MLFSRFRPYVLSAPRAGLVLSALLLATASCSDEDDGTASATDAGASSGESSDGDDTESSGDTATSSDDTASSDDTSGSSDESVTDGTTSDGTNTGVHDAGLPDPHAIPDDASVGAVQCATLASTCHAFDRGTGDQGDLCHDIGHEGDAAECAEHYDECIAFCSSDAGHEEEPLLDGGHEHAEDGGHEHAEDAGHEEPANDAGVTQCQTLGELCHEFDTGDAGLGHECHEAGHEGDPAACAAIYDQCVALCSPADAG